MSLHINLGYVGYLGYLTPLSDIECLCVYRGVKSYPYITNIAKQGIKKKTGVKNGRKTRRYIFTII